MLTDLKYTGDQVRSCAVQGGTWTLVVRQQVGFLLSDTWREWWEEGGSRTYSGGSRVAGIQFPRRGWRRGIFVIGVYAPTSSSTVQERHQLRDQVSNVINMAQATSISLLLGDINAELGNNQNANTLGHTVVGRFARPKITTAGQEWRQWAEAEGFRDCTSRYTAAMTAHVVLALALLLQWPNQGNAEECSAAAQESGGTLGSGDWDAWSLPNNRRTSTDAFSGGPGIMVAPGKTHFRGTSSGLGRSPLGGTSPGS